MIWTKLKALFTGQRNTKGGNSLPPRTEGLTECYAKIDTKHRWQGDVYPKESFPQERLPTQDVPYWMLINRTCHLQGGENHVTKLPYLNYVAVYPLEKFLSFQQGAQNIKNQISTIIQKQESVLFLPSIPNEGLARPLVANFNLIFTFPENITPRAAQKILQLASPFCEHSFQKFSRYFYTVGFDDELIKSKDYISSLTRDMEQMGKKN